MNFEYDIKISFGSFLTGFYLFSVPVFSFSESLGLNILPQLIGVFIVLYAAYDFLKNPSLRINKSLLFYFLFTVYCVFSYYVFAEHHASSEELNTLIKVTIITISIAYLIKNSSDFFAGLLFFFISIFIAVWLNRVDILNLGHSQEILEDQRFSGTFANANNAALYCIAIIWTGFILLFTISRNFFFRIVLIAGIILAGIIIIYSGSRKGLFCMASISIVIAWIASKRYGFTAFRKVIISLLAIGIVYVIFIIIYRSPFFGRVQNMFSDEASAIERIYLFRTAIIEWSKSLKNIIFGIGIDNFRFYNNLHIYSHSTISEILVSCGVTGFVLYFAGFYNMLFLNIYGYKDLSINKKVIKILIIVFLLMVLFLNATAVMYSDRIFWPILGMIISYGAILNNEELSINGEEEIIPD